MNITIVSPLDIAHQCSLMWQAFNTYTKHKCRYIVAKESYLGYPTDILLGNVEAYEIIEHLSNTDFFIFTTHVMNFPFFDLAERINVKNHIVMTYGSEVRMRPAQYLLAWLRTGLMIVTSHDYTQSSPVGFSAQHIPISIDFNELPEKKPPQDDVVRLVHSPTAPKIKGTAEFRQSVANLQKKFKRKKKPEDKHKIEAVMIEGKPWKESLAIKAGCDIFYDQFAIGSYGMGAVESWALRLPVVGRANSWIRSWYPDCPIIDVNDQQSMQTRFEHLITHPELREEAARQGRLFVESNHDIKTNIRKLEFLIKHVMQG